MNTAQYINLPWKSGGRSREGLDCAGLAMLWLKEHAPAGAPEIIVEPGRLPDGATLSGVLGPHLQTGAATAGELLFFRRNAALGRPELWHVAVHLGGGRLLHIFQGGTSRVDNDMRLIERAGWAYQGLLTPEKARELCHLWNASNVGWVMIVPMLLSLALSIAASVPIAKPKLAQFRIETGRYCFDQRYTTTSSTIPLPDVLGAVIVAGNSPYQALIDKTVPVTNAAEQKSTKVVVLCSGPIEG